MLTLLNSPIVFAQRSYQVEIILFEDARGSYLNSESWINLNRKNLNASTGNAKRITQITPHILSNDYKKINASSKYKVLFYGGWKQQGLSKSKAFSINLNQLTNHASSNSTGIIKGNLKLILGHYLHIVTELKYQRHSGGKQYYINMQDRMRSRELHYIDHPLVGMLIQINPA